MESEGRLQVSPLNVGQVWFHRRESGGKAANVLLGGSEPLRVILIGHDVRVG